MSEIINTKCGHRAFRWRLLATVSALVLFGTVSKFDPAKADGDDNDRPVVWIELGGQLERLNDPQQVFNPPFLASITNPGQLSALDVQHQSASSIDEDGKISFQPPNSDLVFSASVQYGRTGASRARHHQTENAIVPVHFTLEGFHLSSKSFYPYGHVKFADGVGKQSESHSVLDFQAGKDLGIGLFGGSSVLSAGVRIAQFISKANVSLHAAPDVQYPSAPISSYAEKYAFKHSIIHFHGYTGMADIQRSFRGLGPSLAWNGSTPFIGGADRGEITFDWGANAAILFGRQKTRGRHQTKAIYYRGSFFAYHNTNGRVKDIEFFNSSGKASPYSLIEHHTNAANINRVRSVTVPNVGGLAGISFVYANAKLSVGYRADFFFGAADGGIDTVKRENRDFYGPFASISIGFGG